MPRATQAFAETTNGGFGSLSRSSARARSCPWSPAHSRFRSAIGPPYRGNCRSGSAKNRQLHTSSRLARARGWPVTLSATCRSESTPGSRSSSGTEGQPAPVARSRSGPAIASCSWPKPMTSNHSRSCSLVGRRRHPRESDRRVDPRRFRGPIAGIRNHGARAASLLREPLTVPLSSRGNGRALVRT